VEGSCEHGNEPSSSMSSYTTGGSSRKVQLHEVS
jgi:hypothetical protein